VALGRSDVVVVVVVGVLGLEGSEIKGEEEKTENRRSQIACCRVVGENDGKDIEVSDWGWSRCCGAL